MFQDPRGQVRNELEPSGFAPNDFVAQATLRTFSADFFNLYALVDNSRSRLEVVFGGKVAGLKTARNQALTARAFIFDDFGPGSNFDNRISLSSSSSAELLGGGPLLGLCALGQRGGMGIRACLSQSLVIGSANHQGVFTDVDDVSSTPTPDGPFTPFELTRSDVPFGTKITEFIPVTEAQLQLTFDIAPHFSIGVGGFVAVWWDAPVAPTWAMPNVNMLVPVRTGLTEVPFPGNWQLEERTLRFAGLCANLVLRF